MTAGGALFAAWPMVYAAAFSGFYIAMILTLMALFFRPVGFRPLPAGRRQVALQLGLGSVCR